MTHPYESRLLAHCAQRLDEAQRRIATLTGALSEEQGRKKPAPDRWSVSECIDHLAVTGKRYLPRLETAIRLAREKGRTGTEPYARGPFAGRFLLSYLDPTKPKRAIPAPRVFRPEPPQEGRDLRRIVAGYCDVNRRLGVLLVDADGLDLGRVKIGSPAAPLLLRISLAQAFEILAIHELRHVAQAEQTRQEVTR